MIAYTQPGMILMPATIVTPPWLSPDPYRADGVPTPRYLFAALLLPFPSYAASWRIEARIGRQTLEGEGEIARHRCAMRRAHIGSYSFLGLVVVGQIIGYYFR